MRDETPLVLAASVASDERRWLAKTLKEAGFEIRCVDDADEAEDEISGHGGRCILVIDSGLLEMNHDAQWRALRQRQAGLGIVVRSWIKKDPGVQRRDDATFLVHPDDDENLVHAVRALASAAIGG